MPCRADICYALIALIAVIALTGLGLCTGVSGASLYSKVTFKGTSRPVTFRPFASLKAASIRIAALRPLTEQVHFVF